MRPLAVAIRMYQRWAPGRVKGSCPGPAQGQLHCSEYGLGLARQMPARHALPLIGERLRTHTTMPAWTARLPRWASTLALAGLVAGGQSDSASPTNQYLGHPGNLPGPVISCPAGQHANHRGTACKPDGPPPQND